MPNSQAWQIHAFIKAVPGCTHADILQEFSDTLSARDLSARLEYLRNKHSMIENRGKRGMGARWFAIDPPSNDDLPCIDEARKLLEGLYSIKGAYFRERYLAQKLEEWIKE